MIVPRDPCEPLTDEHRLALNLAWPNPERLAVALRLATDLETCAALLRGHPVDRDRLNPDALASALERRHVTLGPLICPLSVAA